MDVWAYLGGGKGSGHLKEMVHGKKQYKQRCNVCLGWEMSCLLFMEGLKSL